MPKFKLRCAISLATNKLNATTALGFKPIGWLVAFISSFVASLYPTPLSAGSQHEDMIEEVVVSVARRCGPWAVAHEISRGCEYPVLDSNTAQVVYGMRERLQHQCLSCTEQACALRELSVEDKTVCQRVFTTPRRINRLGNLGSVASARPFNASFTYDISAQGRVENLTLLEWRGQSQRGILRLIQNGARQILYEPLVLDGKFYAITKIRSAYIMRPRER